MWAVCCNHVAVVKLLCRKGAADLRTKTKVSGGACDSYLITSFFFRWHTLI